ncbi:MAG: ABC transporter permease [Acidimicrobiales bacterium]
MWKATIKGLLAHKLRLALTSLAIILGVTFVSGTLVLTDTLRQTFTSLFGQVYSNVNFVVRASSEISGGDGGGANRPPIPESIATRVAAVPGVEYADGGVEGYAALVGHDGKVISSGGAPTLGFSWGKNSQLSQLSLVSGSPPTNAHDVVIDEGTAKKYGFSVGDPVKILLTGAPETFTITGLVRFGSTDNLLGTTIAAFSTPTAQKLFDEVGRYDAIDVLAKPGVDKAQLERAIAAVLPHGVQVVTGQTVAAEQTNEINSALSFFSTALLVFAFIALFVGAFTIFNTFSIIVGQRTRELALLRIVGASRWQVFRSVLTEATIVGAVSSLLGLGLGVVTALGLRALLKGFGLTLPAGSLVFEAHTVVAALAVGVGVTVLSAIGPAYRAVHIPPIAAISEVRPTTRESSRRRVAIGGVVGVLGVVALFAGLAGHDIKLVGVGAVAIFIGAGMLAPVVARPISSVLGRPLQGMLGISGRLGRENSMRSPRRTAQTASALMVGLALISTMAVFGASLSKSATAAVDGAVNANYIVSPSGGGEGFSATVAGAAARVAGVTAVSSIYTGAFDVGNGRQTLTGVSPDKLADTLTLHTTAGAGATALGGGEVLVDTTTASSDHLHVGSVLPVTFVRTGKSSLRVGGIFKPNPLLGSYLVSDAYFTSHFTAPLPVAMLIQTGGAATAAGKAAITRGLKDYPGLTIQTRAEFEKSEAKQVDQLLGLVYALLGLAILIALIGIVNTLLLSVFERTRELGLLRAVGMVRRQVKAMIRSEAVILSVFGAIVGLTIGTGLGVAFSWSLRQDGITSIAVPVSSLVFFLLLAGLLGLGAASWPARRAAKLDVLAAIATD